MMKAATRLFELSKTALPFYSGLTSETWHAGRPLLTQRVKKVLELKPRIGYSAAWKRGGQEVHTSVPWPAGGRNFRCPSLPSVGQGTEVVYFLSSSFPSSGIAYSPEPRAYVRPLCNLFVQLKLLLAVSWF